MTITVTGILKNPQGVAIQNAEIFFEQTQSSLEVLKGSNTTTITSATGQYSFPLALGTYVLKIRQYGESQVKVVASNIVVSSYMNNYSINQILVDQLYMDNIDYDLVDEVFQARDQQVQAANSAQTSQASASSSKDAAQSSASNASTSATNAQNSATSASTSATNAAASAASALASKNAAQSSEANASTHAANALASKNAAQTSATNAATSETNALASKNAAQTSATNAAASETNALASKNAAQTSATNASTSATAASGSATNAATSETNALASKNAAQASASSASTSATNASTSATNASTSATNALNSENKAFKWQENPENSAVETGKYSAKHWAAKAQQSANQAAGALIWRGGWSAQQGVAPPTPTSTSDFYRITAQGTILGVQYEVGDYIHWDNINLVWFKMDGTDSVISVNGKSGQVTLNQQDVSAVQKAGDTMTGALVITKNDAGLVLNPAASTASYILGQQAGVANWYIGKGSTSTNDLVVHSYQHNTALYLMTDRVQTSKALYVGANKVWTAADLELWESRGQLTDLSVASAVLPGYYSFNPGVAGSPDAASYGHGFQINPGTNGAAGVWSTQFAITHTGGKLWYRNGINGAAQGSWSKVYSSTDKPTADDLSLVSRAGDTMTGLLTLTKSADAIKLNPQAGTSSYILGQQNGVNNWQIGKGNTSDDIALISYAHNTNLLLKSDRITADKPFTTSVQQSTLPESMTRRDFVESAIAQAGRKNITITAPAGVVQDMYYPVIFTNISNRQKLYIVTTGGSSTVPMNSCSFSGEVRAWGWGDQGSTVDGMFTIYQTSERAIHSIHRSSESVSYAVYVEGRSFPLEIIVDGNVTVTCTGADTPIGTSIYTVNQVPGVGNTKTIQMVNFDRGQGRYVQANTFGGQGAVYYTSDNKPTAVDTGALPITGGTLTGQLIVRQSGSTQVVIDSPGATDSQIQLHRNSTLRWLLNRDSVAETGSNVGSDLNLFRYNDNGTFAGSVFKIRRSTGVIELTGCPIVSGTQSTDLQSLTRRDFVEQQAALKVSKTGDTMTGALIVTKDAAGIVLNPAANTSSYIMGQQAGVANWYIGKGSSATNDLIVHSYQHSTSMTLASDRITSSKSLYVGSTGKVYHVDNKPTADELNVVSRAGDTVVGTITSTTAGSQFTLNPAQGSSSYILGLQGGANNWTVGKTTTGDDIQLYSYVNDSGITLKSDRVESNKPLYVGTAKVYHTDNKPTLAELLAASAYESSAGRLLIDRRITGATAPSKVGKWQANNSTFTPVPYGSISVTSNNDVEDLVSGTNQFNFYQFHDTYDNRLYLRSDVNGAVTGWDAVMTYKSAILSVDLNALNASRFTGFYFQDVTANATLANNYPIQEAGHLVVTRGPYGVIQEYTTYSSSRKFVRGMTGIGVFGQWNEVGAYGAVGTPTLNSGWTNYGSGYASAQYSKRGNLVTLGGLITKAAGASLTAFTLPVGYRPSQRRMFSVIYNSGVFRMDILTDGSVLLGTGDTSAVLAWISLDGITFNI